MKALVLMAVVVLFSSFITPLSALAQEAPIYLPQVQAAEEVPVVQVQQVEPPAGIIACRVVAGGLFGELLCRVLYIVVVNALESSTPDPTPTPPIPTPIPTPTPIPQPAFWLSSVATEIVRTNRECHFDLGQLARVCLVEGQFPDITPANCPHRVRIAVSFDDGFNPVLGVIPEEVLRLDSKGIRLEFFPVAVDTGESNAYNPAYFTAWAQCE